MQRVHVVLLAGWIAAGAAGCRGGDPPRYLPPVFPRPEAPAARPEEAPAPRGYVGDPGSLAFHRLECPRAKEIDPAVRQYFAVPYDALNARYHPCQSCDPLSGWR